MWGNPKRIIDLRNKILVVQICVVMLKKTVSQVHIMRIFILLLAQH